MRSRNYVIYTVITLLVISSVAYSIFVELSNQDFDNEIFLSTTTSVENTGLLDILINEFEKSHSFSVKYIAVGSGAAIQLARDGEVDAVLVHAPDLEQSLIDDSFSDRRDTLWFNYFIIVGPHSDPANIQSSVSLNEVMEKLYLAGQNDVARFYSRGDQSGTHLKELHLWDTSNITIDPLEEQIWYIETGTGMSSTLNTVDNDPLGYTITDLATYATLKDSTSSIDLKELFGQDDLLFNPYSYLIINPAITGTELNEAGALEFLIFLQEPSTNALVENYMKGDIILFTPID